MRKSNKVVLSGQGYETALVGEIAEFYIDGSLAEHGQYMNGMTKSLDHVRGNARHLESCKSVTSHQLDDID